eukprot:scaffold416153_cov34-Prasinocladus_malaysianus.AAC.1
MEVYRGDSGSDKDIVVEPSRKCQPQPMALMKFEYIMNVNTDNDAHDCHDWRSKRHPGNP